MLQRSPTYIYSQPIEDPWAVTLRKFSAEHLGVPHYPLETDGCTDVWLSN